MKRFNEPVLAPFDIGLGHTLPDRVILEQGKVPVDVYFSAERFAAERDIFGGAWLYAGRSSELPEPGDWIVVDVEVCKASILIVNDAAGGLKAYHNACRHRGMKLMQGQCGHSTRLTCTYHAWSYGTDGQLK